MSILAHPEWPAIVPYLRVELYARDGGHDHPRHRLEVLTPPDGAILRRFLAVHMPCVACGRLIHPIRTRQGGRHHLYFAATCELAVSLGCARSAAARVEYELVRRAVERWDTSHQLLFEWAGQERKRGGCQ